MRTRKMTLEVIIIVIGIIAGILAALAIRFAYSIHDWAELTEELQSENDALRADTGELCKEKLSLMIDVDDLRSENDHLKNQLDDALAAYENSEKERIRISTATTAKRIIESEPAETEPAAARSIPEINWTFDRLPDGLTNTFRCEDYRLFAEGSEQWKLQRDCFTDPETGIRFYISGNKRYLCAAMASAYGITIGSGFEVEFEGGDVINVIMADFKHSIADASADDFGDPDMNYLGEPTTSVLEFVFDKQTAPKAVHDYGGMFVEQFGGLYNAGYDIVNINFEGRIWRP